MSQPDGRRTRWDRMTAEQRAEATRAASMTRGLKRVRAAVDEAAALLAEVGAEVRLPFPALLDQRINDLVARRLSGDPSTRTEPS